MNIVRFIELDGGKGGGEGKNLDVVMIVIQINNKMGPIFTSSGDDVHLLQPCSASFMMGKKPSDVIVTSFSPAFSHSRCVLKYHTASIKADATILCFTCLQGRRVGLMP